MVQHGREHFTTAGDAVGEVAESNDESQQPDKQHRSTDRETAADQPGEDRNEPPADDGAPEDGGERMIGDLRADDGKAVDIFWLQRVGANGERGKRERAQTVAYEHDGPEPQSRPVMSALAQHQGDGVERVLRKELCTSE